MQKLTNKQTVNVVLPKKDYVEPARQKVVIEKNQEENWFQKLLDKLKWEIGDSSQISHFCLNLSNETFRDGAFLSQDCPYLSQKE